MKFARSLLLAITAIVLTTNIVFAASYIANYTIIESDGNSYGMLANSVSVDNQYLADNGFIKASALDTRIQTLGGTVRPHMIVDDKTLTAIAVAADSQTNLHFTTGNANLTSFDVITGYDGKFTTTDDAGLELGDDFELELDGYFDTSAGAGKNIVFKDGAIKLYVSAATDIKAEVTAWDDTVHTLDEQYATGDDGGYSIRGSNWSAQTFTPTADVRINRVSLKIYRTGSPGTLTVSIKATDAGKPSGADLGSGTIDADAITAASPGQFYDIDLTPVNLSNGVQYAIVVRALTGSAGNEVTWRVDSTAPTYAGGSRVWSSNSGSSWTINATVDFMFKTYISGTAVTSVTASGIASGDYPVKVTADTTNLKIYIDGVEEDSTAFTGSVIDTSNDWIIADNTTAVTCPYLSFYKHTVSSVLITRYQPNAIVLNTGEAGTADAGTQTTLDDAILTQADDYWIGARLIVLTTTDTFAPQGEISIITDFDAVNDRLTFDTLTAVIDAGDTYSIDFGTLPDREAASNDARITWGVNPAGIAVTLGGLVSLNQPAAGASADTPDPDILPAAGTSDWFEDPDVSGSLLSNPLRPFVTIMSDTTTLAEMQAWRLLGLAVVIGATVLTIVTIPGHLMIAGIVAAVAIGAMVALTIFPYWALVFIIVTVAGGLVAERSPSL